MKKLFKLFQIRSEAIRLAECNHEHIIKYHHAWFEIGIEDDTEFGATDSYYSEFSSSMRERIKKLNKMPALNFYIQTELCSGNLKDWMSNRNKEDPNVIANQIKIFSEIASAMQYIHSKKIIHRDIKPNNIFTIKKEDEICTKLGDFGLAREINDDNDKNLSDRVGHALYNAPEVQTGQYDFAADVFSLGIILTELFSFTNTQSEFIRLIEVLRESQSLPVDLIEEHPEIGSIILKMTKPKATQRIKASELLKEKVLIKKQKSEVEVERLTNLVQEMEEKLKLQNEVDPSKTTSNECDSPVASSTVYLELQTKSSSVSIKLFHLS